MPSSSRNYLTVDGPDPDRHEFRVLAAGRAPVYSDAPWAPADAARLPLALHALVPVPPAVLGAGYTAAGYAWQCAHWGTERELTEETQVAHCSHFLTYSFDSFGAPPIPWLAAVAEKFPWLGFSLRYIDFGTGAIGLVTFGHGSLDRHYELPDEDDEDSADEDAFFIL